MVDRENRPPRARVPLDPEGTDGERASGRESKLSTSADIGALNQKITHLGQQITDLQHLIEERDQDLAAARAANRELMAKIKATGRHR
jgi:predicted  nucleic acid-binding Zn-ribbon protein